MDTKLIEQVKSIDIDGHTLADSKTRGVLILLLNAVEQLMSENQVLREDNQRLKDEINRLKGEQGRPTIRPQKKERSDVSSEKERKHCQPEKKEKKSKEKKSKIKIDRTVDCPIDRSLLPEDVVFKGYETVVIQDIIVQTDNIEFRKAVYYSPSFNQRFVGELPPGYQGEFGPGVRSLVLMLYHDAQMTQPAIERFLKTASIEISRATISRIITQEDSVFHQEKVDILKAGLQATAYQHIDDTSARVNGKNHYTHVVCNPFYTAYFTQPYKDRLTVLEMLSGGTLAFHCNETAVELMAIVGLSEKQLNRVKALMTDQVLTRPEMDQLLSTLFPDPTRHATNRRIVLESCAVVAYQAREDAINILVCDDAPQFKTITPLLGLCWVHEGRHYKKLKPFIAANQQKLDRFLTDFWDYYRKLLDYKIAPTAETAGRLSKEFDTLFGQSTGYDLLDDRIRKTRSKKENLLLVLHYPDIPLHNNSAELGARAQARKRDISLQTRNDKGTQAKDTMMTLVQTARKLKVNVLHYIRDRVSGACKMPSLASLIKQRSQEAPIVCDTG